MFLGICILFISGLNGQESSANYVLVNYDVQLSLDILPDLDKRKLYREKDKKLLSDIKDVQYKRYRLETFPFYEEQLNAKENIQLADVKLLDGKVNYDDDIPFAFLAKRAIKKKCQEVPYDYFIVTTTVVKKPVIKLVSNLWIVETKIKVLDKGGNELVNKVEEMKLDKPIRSRDFKGGFDKLYREHYDQLYKTLEPYIQKSLSTAISNIDFPF